MNEYCISHSAADAARKAGYSAKTARSIGHELLTKPDIQAEVRARQAAMAAELEITKQQVLSELLEAVQMARLQGNPGAMIQGVREIGKLLGFYEPEVQHIALTVNEQALAAQYQAMSDRELFAIIEGKSPA